MLFIYQYYPQTVLTKILKLNLTRPTNYSQTPMSLASHGFFSRIQQLEKNNRFLPYVYALIGNVTIVLMQMNMKIVALTLNPFFALYMRGFFLLVLNSIVIWSSGQQIDQKDPKTYRILVKRSLSSSIALSCFLGSVPFAPIAVINSLFNVGPIVIFFIEAISTKVPINKVHFGLTILSFMGILLIIKPDFLFGTSSQSWPLIFLILPLVAAFFHAYAMFLVHSLKNKCSAQISLQYFYLVQTFFTGMLQNLDSSEYPTNAPASFYFSMLGLVLFAFITQNLLTRATMLKKASYILPFQYFALIVGTVVDLLVFGQHFDFLSFIGMVLTSVGLLIKLFTKE